MAYLKFDRGTLSIEEYPEGGSLPETLWDPRTLGFRAPASAARAIARRLRALGAPISVPWPTTRLDGVLVEELSLRPYQTAALAAWLAAGRRGVVVVPTGGGKTRIALGALSHVKVPTAILAPTRALLHQWAEAVRTVYAGPVGMVGDGEHRVESVTLMTFESAYRKMDAIGNLFSLLVVDECHHFASGLRVEALEMATAPYRLGLTATPPFSGESESPLVRLLGNVVSEVSLEELLGRHLAPLDLVRLRVALSVEERAQYDESIAPFDRLSRAFRRAHAGADWASLVGALSRTDEGKNALRGLHFAGRLAATPKAKLDTALHLMFRHRDDRTLVFTPDVDAAYTLARRALVPVLSAETSRAERENVLASFREGKLRALVSARVLNEGIDVPDARVAIVVGGTHGPRELVQRIGRVLRSGPGKRALAYELVTSDTLDERRHDRRRSNLVASFPALA